MAPLTTVSGSMIINTVTELKNGTIAQVTQEAIIRDTNRDLVLTCGLTVLNMRATGKKTESRAKVNTSGITAELSTENG